MTDLLGQAQPQAPEDAETDLISYAFAGIPRAVEQSEGAAEEETVDAADEETEEAE